MHNADRRRQVGILLDALAALAAQPVHERVHGGRLLGVLADQERQGLGDVGPRPKPGVEVAPARFVGLADLPHQAQGEGGLAEERRIVEIGRGGDAVKLVAELIRGRIEVAAAVEVGEDRLGARGNPQRGQRDHKHGQR